MKKILLSAAIATISLFSTEVDAQCTAPTTVVTDGVNWIQAITVIDQVAATTVLDGAADQPGRSGDDSGYRDAKATKFDVKAGSEHKFKLYTQYLAAGRAPYHYSVFIDFNDNGDFSDAGEQIFATDAAIAGWYGGSVVTIPADATPGEHVVRFAAATTASDAANPITACNSDYTGEIEDYTVNILGTACTAPTTAVSDGINWIQAITVINQDASITVLDGAVDQPGRSGDDSGYRDAKTTKIELAAGVDHKFKLYTQYLAAGRAPYHYSVFIDFNDNGSFSDAGEQIFATTDAIAGWYGGSVANIPADAIPGEHVIRFAAATTAADAANPITACNSDYTGEIEDYTANILKDVPSVAKNDGVVTKPNVAIDINVLENDVVGTSDVATVAVVTDASNGTTLVNADNTITYTPNTGYLGEDTFTYKSTDVNGLESNEGTVVVTIAEFEGLVKIIEDVENGKGVFDRDVSGSGQSMGVNQTQTEVDDVLFLGGLQSLKLTYVDGENATNAGDFDWYDRFGINHWAGGDVAAIPGIADNDHVYLSVRIKTTTASFGAKVSFLVKTLGDGGPYYVQSETVLLGNHDDNWNLIQIDLKDATKWGDWIDPVNGGSILGGSNGALDASTWINAIIIQGTNNSPDMVLNIDNLIVTNTPLDAPEVNIPEENLSTQNIDLAQVNAYPNPMGNTLNLDLSKDVSSITIYSAIGSVVYTNEAPSKNLVIDTQAWNAGMYFVSVKEGNSTQTIKVIK